MAVTNESSDLMTNVDAVPPRLNGRDRSKGEMFFEEFNFTQSAAAGDINSTARLCKVPAGARVDMVGSWAQYSAFGAARVLSFGWEAHTKVDGTAVTANVAGFTAGLDVSAAGAGAIGSSPTKTALIRTMEGEAVIVAACTGGTIPAGATLRGKIFWSLP